MAHYDYCKDLRDFRATKAVQDPFGKGLGPNPYLYMRPKVLRFSESNIRGCIDPEDVEEVVEIDFSEPMDLDEASMECTIDALRSGLVGTDLQLNHENPMEHRQEPPARPKSIHLGNIDTTVPALTQPRLELEGKKKGRRLTGVPEAMSCPRSTNGAGPMAPPPKRITGKAKVATIVCGNSHISQLPMAVEPDDPVASLKRVKPREVQPVKQSIQALDLPLPQKDTAANSPSVSRGNAKHPKPPARTALITELAKKTSTIQAPKEKQTKKKAQIGKAQARKDQKIDGQAKISAGVPRIKPSKEKNPVAKPSVDNPHLQNITKPVRTLIRKASPKELPPSKKRKTFGPGFAQDDRHQKKSVNPPKADNKSSGSLPEPALNRKKGGELTDLTAAGGDNFQEKASTKPLSIQTPMEVTQTSNISRGSGISIKNTPGHRRCASIQKPIQKPKPIVPPLKPAPDKTQDKRMLLVQKAKAIEPLRSPASKPQYKEDVMARDEREPQTKDLVKLTDETTIDKLPGQASEKRATSGDRGHLKSAVRNRLGTYEIEAGASSLDYGPPEAVESFAVLALSREATGQRGELKRIPECVRASSQNISLEDCMFKPNEGGRPINIRLDNHDHRIKKEEALQGRRRRSRGGRGRPRESGPRRDERHGSVESSTSARTVHSRPSRSEHSSRQPNGRGFNSPPEFQDRGLPRNGTTLDGRDVYRSNYENQHRMRPMPLVPGGFYRPADREQITPRMEVGRPPLPQTESASGHDFYAPPSFAARQRSFNSPDRNRENEYGYNREDVPTSSGRAREYGGSDLRGPAERSPMEILSERLGSSIEQLNDRTMPAGITLSRGAFDFVRRLPVSFNPMDAINQHKETRRSPGRRLQAPRSLDRGVEIRRRPPRSPDMIGRRNEGTYRNSDPVSRRDEHSITQRLPPDVSFRRPASISDRTNASGRGDIGRPHERNSDLLRSRPAGATKSLVNSRRREAEIGRGGR